MQTKTVQIDGLDGAALLAAFHTLANKIDALAASTSPPDPDGYVTRQDVAELFKISLPTVHAWINAGILKPYKIGNKTRFLLSEVKAAAKLQTAKKGVSNG